jgi:hypothetical protein
MIGLGFILWLTLSLSLSGSAEFGSGKTWFAKRHRVMFCSRNAEIYQPFTAIAFGFKKRNNTIFRDVKCELTRVF